MYAPCDITAMMFPLVSALMKNSSSNTRLIVGFHAVNARLRENPGGIAEIYLDDSRGDPRAQDLRRQAAAAGITIIGMSTERLNGLAGSRHQGVAAQVDGSAPAVKHWEDVAEQIDEPMLLLVLDGITDPHNLGACLRVADAMGVHAVIAPKDRAAGLNATVAKVASGAAETVPYLTVTNLARTLRELKEQQVWIVGTAADATTELADLDLTGNVAWILGSEGEGMRRLTREHCDHLVKIPMYGKVESLNVSVAAGICLYESRRQRRKKAAN